MAFANGCRFNAVSSGTVDFVVSSAVTGYQTPALAGATNATTYRYRAESADLSQWELGTGTYTTGDVTLARTTVLYNSSGTGTGAGQSGAGTKISFSAAPQVALTPLKEDLDTFVVGPASSTDNAVARFDSTTGKLLQDSALLVADTTAALSRSGGGGIPLQGTNTSDSAAAGYVGEIIESTVLAAGAVTLTSGVAADITSISLTAGDWDVFGNVFIAANATSTSNMKGWVHTTSATEAVRPNAGAHFFLQAAFTSGGSDQGFPIGMRRFSLGATTTIYLEASSGFSGGTANKAFGYIGARRVR